MHGHDVAARSGSPTAPVLHLSRSLLMKRRKLLQTIAAAPALAAVPRPAPAQTTMLSTATPSTKLSVDSVSPDVVSQPVHRYFTAEQYAALKRLGLASERTLAAYEAVFADGDASAFPVLMEAQLA